MNNIEHTIIKAIYCGGPSQSGLKGGHEYKFSLNREPSKGYWCAKCLDNGVVMLFSCINAMYNNLKSIRLIKSDGTITTFSGCSGSVVTKN